MVLETQLTIVLHARYRVTCHIFLNIHSCFRRLSIPGRFLLRPESEILFVDSLYAEPTEAVKFLAALSVSFPEIIRALGEIS
jgi:hypothetical protein